MKTFIVTGATQGLGLATAQALAQTPHQRVVLAVRDEARGQIAAAAMGDNVDVLRLDLSSLSDVKRSMKENMRPAYLTV